MTRFGLILRIAAVVPFLAACTDERIVFRDRELFTEPPTAAANFDWSPSNNSAIATGGLNTFPAAIAARAGTFILPTAYRGAAAPGGTKWWEGWTNYANN